MDRELFRKLNNAKENNNIKLLEKLYRENPDNLIIKFEYSRRLKDIDRELAIKNLRSLLHTSSHSHALFELGKIYFEDGNIELARKYFNKLLSTSSKNRALVELARLVYSEGNVDSARNSLNEVIECSDSSIEYALQLLSTLDIKEKNYGDILLNYKKNNFQIHESKTLLFLSKELNIFFPKNYERMKYVYNNLQIVDYDEYVAIDRIIMEHTNKGNPKDSDSIFCDNVDVYLIFNYIKHMLTDEYKVNSLNFNDFYIIPYENVGTHGENYIKVVTLPNSTNILSMYPYNCDRDKKKTLIRSK